MIFSSAAVSFEHRLVQVSAQRAGSGRRGQETGRHEEDAEPAGRPPRRLPQTPAAEVRLDRAPVDGRPPAPPPARVATETGRTDLRSGQTTQPPLRPDVATTATPSRADVDHQRPASDSIPSQRRSVLRKSVL